MTSKAKPATLGAGLIVKGGARPSDATAPVAGVATAVTPPQDGAAAGLTRPSEPAALPPQVAPTPPTPAPQPANRDDMPVTDGVAADDGMGGTKAMTVKVSGVVYNKLKMHGFQHGKTSQAIFQEALQLYFKKYGVK